ncbi:cytochrome b [Sphingobium sp. DEHP117]|uniref:cytochrome b n=1 Tax=Sphingobium sp. DEHP117 TaxID=2993436 RepID=UPI0027D62BB3|nr:cytochrome b/b6 domain-containing protein [Sphingobium sp. DEHP117]MDQ4421354.1 cytochrome b [Sphingobium sp. DEHP117]
MSDQGLVKYDGVARALHWVMALAIIIELRLGLTSDAWEANPWAPGVHKSIGLTILMLTLFRLGWRLKHTPPALPADTPHWQAVSARGLHILFYVMMIGVPLSGWIFTSAGPYPLNWFGLFDIPKLAVVKGSLLAEAAHEGHEIMGTLFLPLLLLHVGAALYHHFRLKDKVLKRML